MFTRYIYSHITFTVYACEKWKLSSTHNWLVYIMAIKQLFLQIITTWSLYKVTQ